MICILKDDAAARERLEKAGCEDAEFTGYYEERPCLVKYEEYSYSTADDKDSYNRAMKASGTSDLESAVYYRYTDGDRKYIIAVPYRKIYWDFCTRRARIMT